MNLRLSLLLSLPVLLAAAAPSPADSLDPGSKPLVQEVRVDLGAWEELAPWRYTVRKKDTLSQIAETHLGRARRQPEIAALNPGLDAKSLRAGASIWLPARKAPSWHFFAATGGDASPARVGDGDSVALPHGGLRLLAVPHERWARLKALGRRLTARGLLEDPVVARSEPIFPMAWTEDGDPAAKVVVAYEVVGLEGRTIALERTGEERFGRGGIALAASAAAEVPPEPLLLWTLGGIAALAVGLLVARWMRTRDAVDGGRPAP